jgi:hypothetical protein
MTSRRRSTRSGRESTAWSPTRPPISFSLRPTGRTSSRSESGTTSSTPSWGCSGAKPGYASSGISRVSDQRPPGASKDPRSASTRLHLLPDKATKDGAFMEPRGCNRSQSEATQQRVEGAKQAKSVAVGCQRLLPRFHGKEGVDGSSPSEGLSGTTKPLQKAPFLLPRWTRRGPSFPRRGSAIDERLRRTEIWLEHRRSSPPRDGPTRAVGSWGRVLGAS